MKFITIYATYTNNKEAEKIISGLLKGKLIACANLFDVASMYHWKGKIEKGKETVSIIKTKEGNWSKVENYIKKNHSYETPCIINMGEMTTTKEFFKYVNKETV